MADEQRGATEERELRHERDGATDGDELRFDDDGIVFATRESPPLRVETVTVHGRVLYRLPWADVRSVVARDPWPHLRITFDSGDGDAFEDLDPRAELGAAFADRVASLLATAPERAPHARLDAGWLGAPDIEWERVKRMPHEQTWSMGQGAYRSTEGSHAEIVRAHRPVRAPLRGFLDWLGSHPGFAFREQPLEVVVTDDDVYARFRDESARRVPRTELRAAVRGARGEVVYVFGRRARLLLPHVDRCPVQALLDEALAHRV